jgi:hypothetical protein
METTDVLRSSVQHTHDLLSERLEFARDMVSAPSRPREANERIDVYLAAASKHLHAVDAVLLQAADSHLADSSQLVHDYLHAERELELALAHVKGREYGSALEAGETWDDEWTDVLDAAATQRSRELDIVDRLSEALDGSALDDLTQELHRAEAVAPTRPHPYVPHTGMPGRVARKVMHTADSFWDAAEGRMVPEAQRKPHKPPGLFAQYLLADPRFEEEEEEEQ